MVTLHSSITQQAHLPAHDYCFVSDVRVCVCGLPVYIIVATELKLAHIGGQRKFPIHLWKIVTTDLVTWKSIVSKTRVLNMIFTKKPELII